MNINLRKGLRFEDLARQYLIARGLQLVESNYRCRFGEIDLIMRDSQIRGVGEGRFLNSRDFGGASASITTAKQRRIIKAALFSLSGNHRELDQALRFDALLIQQQDDAKLDYNWIQSAFYAE